MATKVLHVDDSPLAHQIVGSMLRNGFEVRWLRRLEGLAAEVKDWRPDVVLTDLNVGASTGLDTYDTICESWPGPIVVLTNGGGLWRDALPCAALDKGWSTGTLATVLPTALNRAAKLAVEPSTAGVVFVH